MSAMRVRVPGVQYSFWRSNDFLFLLVWSRGLHFRKDSKVNSWCNWRCVLSNMKNLKVCLHFTNKTASFYDCKKRKACCHILNITFKDQKLTLMLFGGDGTHCFEEMTSRNYEKEKQSPFLKNFLHRSQRSTSEPQPKKVEVVPFMAWSCRHPIGWYSYAKLPLKYLFIHFQSTLKQHDFLSLQRRYWVISRLWTRFSDSDCKGSHPGNDNKFPRNSTGNFGLVFWKRTVLEQQSSSSSSYPQPARNTWNKGRSTFKCRYTTYGDKQISCVCWSGRCWILLGKWSVGCRRCF